MRDRLGGPSLRSDGERRLRWALAALAAGLVVAGGTSLLGTGGAAADSAPGQGSSYAQLLQVTPHEWSLAVGAVFGEALAGHTDTVARAQSQGMDLGAVGQSAQGYNCGNPPNQYIYNAVPEPLETETGQQGADQGVTQSPSQSDYFATEYVKATSAPYGEADTTYAGPVADPTNAFAVTGMRSKAWSGNVNGVNEAGATSDIASLDIGGVVVLDGLHWEVLYPTGAQPTASFSIAHAIISGTALPTTADLSAVQGAINQALGTIGLQVQLPVNTEAQGIDFLSPLQVEVVPNATRDAVLDPAVTGLQPVYYQMANGLENGFSTDQSPYSGLGQVEATPPGQQLEAGLCQTDTPITVTDITVASFDGGGYFNAALGGVNATSSTLPANSYNLSEFSAYSLPGSTTYIPGTGAASGTTPGILGTPAATAATSATSAGGGSSSPAQRAATGLRLASRQHGGTPAGGPLLAAGLGGLGLMALLAEGDRRMMRRAQRTAIIEE